MGFGPRKIKRGLGKGCDVITSLVPAPMGPGSAADIQQILWAFPDLHCIFIGERAFIGKALGSDVDLNVIRIILGELHSRTQEERAFQFAREYYLEHEAQEFAKIQDEPRRIARDQAHRELYQLLNRPARKRRPTMPKKSSAPKLKAPQLTKAELKREVERLRMNLALCHGYDLAAHANRRHIETQLGKLEPLLIQKKQTVTRSARA